MILNRIKYKILFKYIYKPCYKDVKIAEFSTVYA